ncbi:Dicarboxylate/Amino Acid:Cation (Na or H) Symporter (DAACS) family [Phytophthora cinnamomi]|uniref:Dicarboxylate/Amino Acid:Cation (Na or H) Symporter (DAACS) family n=1 Tax=Phytophthora cinnamomi TaxID=4785 RepID=UPI00355A136D|nr:Dicarboxylate/Amino Acid:Cation (Na or H) Symporter (DAACS) family [Phytophthora cinnamomi]
MYDSRSVGSKSLYDSESGFSLTPHSAILQFDFNSRDRVPPPTQRTIPFSYRGLGVKDMITSPYDQSARVSIWQVALGAGIGLTTGAMLIHYEVNGAWADWIAMPGILFIEALKCLVIPMVFCSVVVCIGELVEAGKAASIGRRIITSFAMASIASSTIGTLFAFAMSHLYPSSAVVPIKPTVVSLTFQCADGTYLSYLTNGTIACSSANSTSTSNMFVLSDVSGYLKTSDTKFKNLNVSEQIFSILKDLVPENIFESFAGSSTLSVIAFAIWVGVALVKSVDREAGVDNYPLLMVTHANAVILMLVNIVVKYIPIAVISLIAGSLASYSSSTELVEGVAFLLGTLIVALLTLTVGVFGLALFVTTRRNIFSHLWQMVPAQIFIFGCSSSIATLPITMRCVDATKEVSYQLSRFMLPLGATSNLNGTAVYMPLACVFLAKVGGYDALLTPLRFVLLGIVSAIASFGVAGVPHAGLVMVLTVWRTVFGVDVPVVFSILVSTDWVLDRLRSIVNITNDTIIVRIIAARCDETILHQLSTQHTEGTELLSHMPRS